MNSTVLTVIACSPIVIAWLAVCVYHCLAVRRRRRQHAEWARLAVSLADLDADLDRAWTAEKERIWRYR